MDRPPRDKEEPILTRGHWRRLLGYSAVITASVLVALAPALSWLDLSEAGAVTISFLTLAFAQLFDVFNMRDPSASFLDNDVTRSLYVWLALLLCVALLVGSAYLPVISNVLELEPPELLGWAVVLVLALVPVLAGETARRSTSAGRRTPANYERESR